jgi:hypothetical protein
MPTAVMDIRGQFTNRRSRNLRGLSMPVEMSRPNLTNRRSGHVEHKLASPAIGVRAALLTR